MARTSAEEAGLDAAAAEAERQTRAAASAAPTPEALAAQRAGGQATVLATGPIPEVKLGPAAGAPPLGGDAVDPDIAGRFLLDPGSTAPVVADARKRAPYKRAGAEQRLACTKCGAAATVGKFCAECGGELGPAPEPAPGDAPGAGPRGAKPARFFAVVETKMVLDRTGGHRTPLRAGKVISTQHYDVAGLLRQGVRLTRVDGPTAAGTDEALIDALTSR